jgi:predicted ABC-type ATPase
MPSRRTSPKSGAITKKDLALPTASSEGIERPKFWIVAGPNGSGKSSLYDNTDIESFGRSVWIINPDLLSARIRETERRSFAKANLEAVKRIEMWLEASINAHQTVGVETVLSTKKYRRLVNLAKKRRFEINLIYVMLKNVELNIERVRLRVAKGGHAVPTRKIRERHTRSLQQLPWFLKEADRAFLYDNSGASLLTLGTKEGGVIRLDSGALPEIKSAVAAIQTN